MALLVAMAGLALGLFVTAAAWRYPTASAPEDPLWLATQLERELLMVKLAVERLLHTQDLGHLKEAHRQAKYAASRATDTARGLTGRAMTDVIPLERRLEELRRQVFRVEYFLSSLNAKVDQLDRPKIENGAREARQLVVSATRSARVLVSLVNLNEKRLSEAELQGSRPILMTAALAAQVGLFVVVVLGVGQSVGRQRMLTVVSIMRFQRRRQQERMRRLEQSAAKVERSASEGLRSFPLPLLTVDDSGAVDVNPALRGCLGGDTRPVEALVEDLAAGIRRASIGTIGGRLEIVLSKDLMFRVWRAPSFWSNVAETYVLENVADLEKSKAIVSQLIDEHRQILFDTPVTLMISDEQDRIEAIVNPALATQEKAIGRALSDVQRDIGVTQTPARQAILAEAKLRGVWTGGIKTSIGGVERYFIGKTTHNLRAVSGSLGFFRSIWIDVTEYEKARIEAVAAQRFAAMGELASGVAHELNQPLNVIGLLARNVKLLSGVEGGGTGPALEPMIEKINSIIGQVQRATAIIDRMKRLTRLERMADETVDIADLIRAALSQQEVRFEALAVTLEADVPASPLLVRGDTIAISQVLGNLLNNALDAVAGRKLRRVRIGLDEDLTSITVCVSDTGGGVAPENQHKVFDPFFTTKPVGKGTGLGLAISKRLVESVGGSLTLRNTTIGAEFLLELLKPESQEGAGATSEQ